MLSIEAFAGTNLLMNILILCAAVRCSGHIRWRRVLLASAFGTVYAAAAYASGWIWLRSVSAQLVCMAAMALTAMGRRNGRSVKGWLRLAGCTVFAGGVMTLLSRWFPSGSPLILLAGWAGIAAGMVLSDCAPAGVGRVRPHRVRLRIGTRMGSSVVEALMDTGNCLREPVSGLPVLIVGRDSLRGILDDMLLSPIQGRLPPGFRMVRYGVLGGEGEMLCFRPASVCYWCDREWREAPDMWVAIYPGDMPSEIDALAPPVF